MTEKGALERFGYLKVAECADARERWGAIMVGHWRESDGIYGVGWHSGRGAEPNAFLPSLLRAERVVGSIAAAYFVRIELAEVARICMTLREGRFAEKSEPSP